MNKKETKILIIVCSVILIISPLFFIKNNNKNKNVDKNIIMGTRTKSGPASADLVFFKAYPYKNVEFSGDNLIDGIYGNRTVYVFRLNDINEVETINYKNGEKTLSFNNHTFKKDGILYIASATDNIVDPTNQKVTIEINGSNNNGKVSINQVINTSNLNEDTKFIVSDPKTTYNKSNDSQQYIEVIKEYDVISLDTENPLIKEENIQIDKNLLKDTGITTETIYTISNFGGSELTNVVGVKTVSIKIKFFTTKEDIDTENKIKSVIESVKFKI